MTIKNLLITATVSDDFKKRLAAMLPETEIVYKKDAEPEDVERADVLFGSVEPDFLADRPNLKWIQTSSAGTDHIAWKIPPETRLTNATGAFGPAISEYMLAVTLSAMKCLPQYMMNQKAHMWHRDGTVRYIEDSVLLVLGLGDIGAAFARKMKALGAYTIGVRRLDSDKPDYMDEVHLSNAETIDRLIPRADVIALALPNNPETHHTLNAARMAMMKPGAIVINVGRGGAIDTDALVEGLRVGKPSFACLDVTDPEPLPFEHPLWDANNVIITPHCSGWQRSANNPSDPPEIFLENVAAFLEDHPLRNLVDRETGYRKTF